MFPMKYLCGNGYKMLVFSIFALLWHVTLCARNSANLDFHNRDGEHLEHEQHTMIYGYVYGAISHSNQGLQALRRYTSSSIPTLTLVLHNLHQRTDTILRLCLPQYASPGQEEYHSFLVPCGMLFGIAVGPTPRKWELRTTSSSSLNITIRHVTSVWDKVSCDYFPNLRLTDSRRSHSARSPLDVTICGSSPQQTHFSASSNVMVSWQSRMFDVNKESFLLSYETVVPGYAKHYYPKIKMCTACSENCTTAITLQAFHLLMYKGNEYTYTWHSTGLVLTAPTLHINEFRCTDTYGMDEKIRLTVYDAPISLLDSTFMEMDPSRVIQTLVCSDSILNESHKSSIGDLTLITTARTGYIIEFNVNVVYVPIPCNDTACSAVTHSLFWGSPKVFRLLSQGTSQQRAIFWPRPGQKSLFITLEELQVNFQGFTHMPCSMGGLFLYYMQPFHLIGQVCSDWTAEIWSRTLKRKDRTAGLYLGARPVMIVIKTYKGFTEGTIEGRVMLDNCLGVINPGLRGNPLPSPYYNYASLYSTIGRLHRHAQAVIIHQAGCITIQYVQTDIPDCVPRFIKFTTAQLIRHRPNNGNLQPEFQFVTMSNISAYPGNLIRLDRLCHVYFCLHRRTGQCWFWEVVSGTGQVVLSRRPGNNGTVLEFDTFCLAAGTKIFFRAYFINTQSELCWTSQKFRKFRKLVEIKQPRVIEKSYYNPFPKPTIHMPAVPFFKLPVKENIFGSGATALYVTFLRPVFTNNLCCVLHLSILANPLSNISFEEVSVRESYWSDDDIYHNVLLWKYPEHLSLNNSKGINGLMYTLKRVLVRLNYLHQEIDLTVTGLWRDRSACPSKCSAVFLQLEYNFTPYSVTHQTVKMLKHYTCAVATNSCYSFRGDFQKMTWNSAVGYCSNLNMTLLTTPSDLEWNFISHLFAQRPNILRLGSGMQLSYMGLLYSWVSVIPLDIFIDLVINER